MATIAELPQLQGTRMVTDGGMETDLIFHRELDLPGFASFPLLEDDAGRAELARYYDAYAVIAGDVGAGLLLEAPTWRANPDWGARLGYDADALARVNEAAVTFLHGLRAAYAAGPVGEQPVVVGGMIGPRGDGYVVGARMGAEEAAVYHRPQIAAFAAAGADLVSALTLTYPDEAAGIVLAARDVGLPVAVSFTVETDGRVPDEHTVAETVEAVDTLAPPDYFLLNCAHPEHVLAGLEPGPWTARILGTRVNASRLSHAELDAAEDLDEGDPAELADAQQRLTAALPALTVLGGCCGTDARHVRAMWERWAD